jgi:hypothetical protein
MESTNHLAVAATRTSQRGRCVKRGREVEREQVVAKPFPRFRVVAAVTTPHADLGVTGFGLPSPLGRDLERLKEALGELSRLVAVGRLDLVARLADEVRARRRVRRAS